jgi:hypothetical protein
MHRVGIHGEHGAVIGKVHHLGRRQPRRETVATRQYV